MTNGAPPVVTMDHLVADVRGTMNGSLGEEMTVLDEDYIAGSGRIKLRYAKRAVPGSVLSVGLNTFYVLEVDSSGKDLIVQPGIDGSRDETVLRGAILIVRPRQTNWQIWIELVQAIHGMSSTNSGLYAIRTFSLPSDTVWNTYPVPTDLPPILRPIAVSYTEPGSTDLAMNVPNWSYDPHSPSGRLFTLHGAVPGGVPVEFTVATPFTQPFQLSDNVITDVGLLPSMLDIPVLKACWGLSGTMESRRNQPFSQGDPRRAAEVLPGANMGSGREFYRRYKERTDDEYARLVALYPPRRSMVPR